MHPALKVSRTGDDKVLFYEQAIVTVGRPSQHKATEFELYGPDGQPLRGPHNGGSHYWDFGSNDGSSRNIPTRGSIIKCSLKAKPKTGRNAKANSFYQDCGGWVAYTGDDMPSSPTVTNAPPQQGQRSSAPEGPPEGPLPTPPDDGPPPYASKQRTDATGKSIERQVAFKGVIELAAATDYDTSAGGKLVELALAMAEELWGEPFPVPHEFFD